MSKTGVEELLGDCRKFHSLGSLKYSLYYIFFLTLMSLIPYDTNVFIT